MSGLPGTARIAAGDERTGLPAGARAALALNCTIASHPGQPPGFTKWDRKNYYYPDLPKNYQISQYDLPFSHDGWLEINVAKDAKKEYAAKRIGIIRAHLEEDAGKNLHDESGKGGDSLVDLNRTGTPLLEIVSHPDMNSPEEAIAYLEEIRLLLREIGVSDCEMQEGSLRCDANVNIHIPKVDEAKGYAATPLVEIKNLNSFRGVGRAIAYEARRHYEEFQKNPDQFRFGKLLKTTAGWDDARGVTVVQRHKEEAADYRYFPEPDLVPVVVSPVLIAEVKAETGELPSTQRARLQSQYGLSPYDAQVLIAKGRATVAYFETVAAAIADGKTAANRMSDLIYPALVERKEEIEDPHPQPLSQRERGVFPLSAATFAAFLKELSAANSQDRRDVLKVMLEKGVDIGKAKELVGIKAVDETALRIAARQAIAANPKAVADFKKGKEQAKMSIVGAVMKSNKGAPNNVVRRLVDEELAKEG